MKREIDVSLNSVLFQRDDNLLLELNVSIDHQNICRRFYRLIDGEIVPAEESFRKYEL